MKHLHYVWRKENGLFYTCVHRNKQTKQSKNPLKMQNNFLPYVIQVVNKKIDRQKEMKNEGE